MANTLTNFLIGIGFETTDFDKGEKKVNSGLKFIKTGAGLAGAALAGVGLAIGGAVSAGNRIDKLALASAKLNTSASFVNNYGNALRLLGGDASESLQAIDAAESALAEFKLKGSFGAFQDPALVGIDVNSLAQAKNGEDFLRQLSAQIPKLNKDQQRLIQDNFGFSDATMASLRLGQQEFDKTIAKAEQLAPNFDAAVAGARAFDKELTSLQLRFEGMGNNLAASSLSKMSSALESVNTFIDRLMKNSFSAKEGQPTITDFVNNNKKQYEKTQAEIMKNEALTKPNKAITNLIPKAYRQRLSDEEAAEKRANYARTGQFKSFDQIIDENARTDSPNRGWRNNLTMIEPGTSAESLRINAEINRDKTANVRERAAIKQPPIQVNNVLKVELDGQAFDARVTQVQTRRDNNTIDDIRSTTSR